MDIDTQIKELESKKRQLEQKQTQDKIEQKKVLNRSVIGKFFKITNRYSYGGVVGTNRIKYVRVIDFIRYSDGKIMYGEESENLISENFNIEYSPVGWKLVPDKNNSKNKRLAFTSGQNKTIIDVKKYHKEGSSVGGTSLYEHSYFKVASIDEKGLVYDGREWWTPCTGTEYYSAYRDSLNYANGYFETMSKYFNKFNHETEEMIPYMDDVMLLKVANFLENITTQNINIDMLVNTLSGKVGKYNYINNNFELSELAQYSTQPQQGMDIKIVGGDDGTDYEPYTTHYYIVSIDIDWKHILYPIRTHLKSVLETEKQLLKLKNIYNSSNWDCNYDTSTYDATFHSVKLHINNLKEINEVIKNNLK